MLAIEKKTENIRRITSHDCITTSRFYKIRNVQDHSVHTSIHKQV